MREIGAFEAKTRVGQLLNLVEAGEEFAITRRGKVVARTVARHTPFDPERGLRAVERIHEMHKGVTPGRLAIRDLIDEGRL